MPNFELKSLIKLDIRIGSKAILGPKPSGDVESILPLNPELLVYLWI